MHRRYPAVLFVSAFLVILSSPFWLGVPPSHEVGPPDLAPTEGRVLETDGRIASAREKWFVRQRLYPFKSIHEDLRTKAFHEMQQMEKASRGGAAYAAEETPSWVSVGPKPTTPYFSQWQKTSGRIRAIAISPADPSIVLIGSSSGGIWRSTDGAQTFTPVSDDQADLSVASLAFAPSDPEIVYAGMGGEFLGSGVLKSTDAGATWTRIDESGLPDLAQTVRIQVDPTDPDRVLLGQNWKLGDDGELTNSGVYQSLDGGRTWIQRIAGFPKDVLLDPSNPSIMYATFGPVYSEGKLPSIWRSTDGGETWNVVFNGPYDTTHYVIFTLAASPAMPGRVYMYESNATYGYSIFISDDYGETWRQESISGISGPSVVFKASPDDGHVLYFGQYSDLYRSTDAGATWTNLTGNRTGYYQSKTHPDQFAIAFIPGSGGEFLLGNDGGLYRSRNGADSFTALNDTLSLTQIYGITAHPTRRGMLLIGAQDNGAQLRASSDAPWTEFFTGDYGRPWVDPLHGDRICANYYSDTIVCASDYGRVDATFVAGSNTFGSAQDGRVAFIAPLVGNGIDETLYFATWRFFESTDGGITWTKTAGDLDLTFGNEDVVTAIAPAPSSPSVLYTGSSEGRVMRSSDGGATWTEASTGLPSRFITAIAVHPTDPNRLWVTFSGYRASHVFGSTDGGVTWTDLQANLPDVPVDSIWVDPGLDGRHILLGTDIGVFRSVDGGQSWAPFDDGLPPVIVNGFSFGPDGALYAGTYGRGVYALTFPKPPRRHGVRR